MLAKIRFKQKQIINLFSLLFGALGFSSGIIIVRFFLGESELSYIINLQSYVVFTSFLLQLGLRAGLRAQIYGGRLLLSRLTEKTLHILLLFFSIFSFLFETISNDFYYFCLSSLLAMVTLRLAFNVADDNAKAIFFNSLATFLVAIGSSLVLIFIKDHQLSNIVIEAVALICVIFFALPFNLKKIYFKRKSIFKVLWLAQSYQLGAGVIALFMFTLTQTALIQLTSPNQLVAYSDALIASGFLVLLLGKILLLLERKLYVEGNNHFLLFSILILGQVLISILISSLLHFVYGVELILYFSILFILLSRLNIGYIVQYVSKYRNFLNILSVLYILFYSIFIFFGVAMFDIVYQILPILLFIIMGFIFFCIRKVEKL